MVGAPEEIDLVTIAWSAGRLTIESGNLETAEGRLVASPDGGCIRISEAIRNEGRRRFVIGHEIGHFCLHKATTALDTAAELADWRGGSRETEANIFSGELLMPDFLFKPLLGKQQPSLRFLDSLAARFATSTLATAFQYVSYTNEQVALVVSQGDQIQWSHRSKDFWPHVRRGTLSPDSAAGEIVAGKCSDTNKMVTTPAHAWLTEFDYDNEHDIMEDSRYLDYYDRTISLLWLEEDLED
jgi:Zn-dependent peptidase ImmA (M78 family)